MTSLLVNSQKTLSIRNVLLSIFGLIISSKVAIPLCPVPITLQMLAIYYVGMMLSPKEAFASVLSWLFLGACGYPVFASAFGGISGPSSGYLVGMLLGCPIIGFAIKRGFSPVISCICCYVVTHVVGCIWLSYFISWNEIFLFGVLPFLIPEILKITLASAMFIKRRN